MYDVIIIGAGPAGLTASIYARRASLKTLVLEAKAYGGQIINTPSIENYPGLPNISGFDFATKLYEQSVSLKTEFKFEKVLEINDYEEYKEVITQNNTFKTKTIILATGTQNRKLELPNEENLIGKGISYCATCDGNFYKNKIVAVIGGGNTAFLDAIYLSNIASKVYLIYRGTNYRAENTLIEEAKSKQNIEFITETNITKINGIEKLDSIELDNEKKLEIDGLFIAIGQIPSNTNYKNLINLNENGYIMSTELCHTNVKGIFVAGDNREKDLRQLVTATSDGAIAATEAVKYIK